MRCVRLCLALVLLSCAASRAVAQPAPGTPVPDSSAAPARPDIGKAAASSSQPQQGADTNIALPTEGGRSTTTVALDPETLWRPRNAEVRFSFTLHAETEDGPIPTITRVKVDFMWSKVQAPPGAVETPSSTPTSIDFRPYPSPLVRNIPTTTGVITYGAIVPDMAAADVDVLTRIQGTSPINYTGVYTVPVANMLVTAYFADGSSTPLRIVLPVGITSLPAAFVTLGLSLALSVAILWRWAPPFAPARAGAKESLLKTVSRHGLAVISSPSGVASLSQFQIMLWTFTVFAASVYVMVLSGNLIGISDGTLILLGIAGGTSVITRATQLDTVGQGPQRWAQLLVRVGKDGKGELDVTRIQMLIFTLVSAAFVTIKVAVTYEIPDIPANFLLLMGISNGVYIGGRQAAAKAGDA